MVRENQILNPPSVAQKLSWASMRKTSRKEDMAYCLLGIFNLNIPLLYGEGDKVFLRLQQEILRMTNDETMFAWRSSEYSQKHLGVLAPSPKAFAHSWKFQRTARYDSHRPPYSLTNPGLDFRRMVIQQQVYSRKILDRQVVFQSAVLLPLNCTFVFDGVHYTVAIEVSQRHTTDDSLDRRPTYRAHADALYVFDTFRYENAMVQARKNGQTSVAGRQWPPVFMIAPHKGHRLSLSQMQLQDKSPRRNTEQPLLPTSTLNVFGKETRRGHRR